MGFAATLIAWQRRHGRHGLPWQGTRDPYRIWLAEVMLQQTQVATVVPYYERFLARYPDVAALAAATEEDVLRLWSGLGYYARARNLHSAAMKIAFDLKGKFPRRTRQIQTLPGVGRSTGAAIAAFAFGERAAILDGNVKRVLARRFGCEGEERQWKLARRLLPWRGIAAYTQALMDLGATVCTRAQPACGRCPVARACVARREGRIHQLPAPRRRAAQPLRRATWLVMLRGREVLLERRPGKGIWGGLWCFPELGRASPLAQCRDAFGCEVGRIERLPAFEHGFTHFRLKVQPLRCPVRRVRPGAPASKGLWLGIEDAARAAVPAPVRTLLSGLA